MKGERFMRKFVSLVSFALMIAFLVCLMPYYSDAAQINNFGTREPEVEPNDDFINATRVSFVNNNASFLGSLNYTNDPDDFYNITIPAGLGLIAKLTILSYDQTKDFDLYLYNSMENMVTMSASEVEVEVLAYRGNDEDSYYYLEVYSYAGSGNYRLELSIVLPPPSDGDDTLDSAYPLNTNPVAPNPIGGTELQYINITGSLDVFDNQDWYKVYLFAGDVNQYITANLTILNWNESNPSLVDYDLILYDNWDILPFEYNASFTYNKNEIVYGAASYTGQYYLVVRRYSGEGEYSLNISITTVPSDKDNIPKNATQVYNGTIINGSVDQVLDHYDWYKVNLVAGNTIDILYATLTLDWNVKYGTEFAMGIYDENLMPLDYISTDYEDTIVFTPEYSGVYYIAIIADGVYDHMFYTDDMGWATYVTADCAKGNYTLEIEIESLIGDSDNDAKNATPAHATQASTLGSAVDISDWYCLGLAQDSILTVNLTILCNADFDLFVYNSTVLEDPANARIGVSEGITNYEEITVTIPTGGIYYIEVRAFMGTGEGDYILNISVNPVSQPPFIITYSPKPLVGNVMNMGESMHFVAYAIDFNSGSLTGTWQLDGNTVYGSSTGNTFEYTFTPTSQQVGSHTIKLTVSDGTHSTSIQWVISVNINNSKPVISSKTPSEESISVSIDSTTTFLVSAYDPEGSPLSYKWFLDNGTGYQQVADSQTFTFKALPSMAGKTVYVYVEITDDYFQSVSQTWHVSIEPNGLPVISSFTPGIVTSIKEGESIHFQVNASDPEGKTLSYTWYLDDIEVGISSNSFIREFNFTSQGEHVVRCNVTDEYGGVQEIIWSVHVENVNL
ncbi:MAG: PKD domain-containing protein, partial [Thermoplasmata archaeon]